MKPWQFTVLSTLNSVRGLSNLVSLGIDTGDGSSDTKRAGIIIGESIYLLAFVGFAYDNLKTTYEMKKENGSSQLSCSNCLCILFFGPPKVGNVPPPNDSEKTASFISGMTFVMSTGAVCLLSADVFAGFWLAAASVLLSISLPKQQQDAKKDEIPAPSLSPGS